jgi:hypothetical protein
MLLEDSDAAAEVSGLAAVLLDSAAADRASITELLMGSWLGGMSTTWLELLCRASVCSELFCVASFCSELLCCAPVCSVLSCFVTAGAEESEAALSPALTLLELGWDSSEDEAGVESELADELSSQAFSVNAAIIPSDAASALLAAMENCFVPVIFFFSIFIFQPSRFFREFL